MFIEENKLKQEEHRNGAQNKTKQPTFSYLF